MSNVKQTLVPQIDRLLVQHRRGDHPKRDQIPRRPQFTPVIECGHTKRRMRRQGREGHLGTLQEIERSTAPTQRGRGYAVRTRGDGEDDTEPARREDVQRFCRRRLCGEERSPLALMHSCSYT